MDHDEIRTTTLPSGLRVVTEPVPGARSVTVGFWVGVGARDEAPELAGASHFLEHLLFKGTATRSAADIAEAVDAVGGEVNAFTTAEYTAFYTRLPAGQLDLAVELLSDVVWSPAFRPPEVEAERSVILEELLMNEDDPEDRVHGLLLEHAFPGHGLGREVLGSAATIEGLARDDLAAFHRRWYRPANMIVAASGALDHGAVVAGVAAALTAAGADGEVSGGPAPDRRLPPLPPAPVAALRRATEQGHVAVGVRTSGRGHPDRFALAVANHVLGGGMSSRLFQRIREERGLAYSVYSGLETHTDAGLLAVYAGTAPRHLPEVLRLLQDELDRLAADGITEHERAVAVGYLTGSTILALEDPAARMSRLGKHLLLDGAVLPVEEVLDRFRAVTVADVRRAAEAVLARRGRTVAVVGPLSAAQVGRLVA